MSAVFVIVILAAALHASWNAVVKRGSDTFLATALISSLAALTSAAALPFLRAPAPASWPFVAASSACQVAYYVLVAKTYRVTDMSLAYPLMRGTAPLIVAVASAGSAAAPLAPRAWLGVSLICAGVLSMATVAKRETSRAGIALALGNAVVIACYTLNDAAGVRRSGAPAAYTSWIFLLTGLALTGWTLVTKRGDFQLYIRRNWASGLLGGIGTVTSYGLALWAMTIAPVAIVAALRETSVLFGTAISALLLHERAGKARLVGVGLIATGAVALRLA